MDRQIHALGMKNNNIANQVMTFSLRFLAKEAPSLRKYSIAKNRYTLIPLLYHASSLDCRVGVWLVTPIMPDIPGEGEALFRGNKLTKTFRGAKHMSRAHPVALNINSDPNVAPVPSCASATAQ